MSRENSEIASMVDLRADFDFWVSEKNWKEAWVAINAMGEYDPNEALRMHQELNCAKNDFVYIPVEDNDHPVLTPEEDDAPAPARHESEYATEYNDDGELKTFRK